MNVNKNAWADLGGSYCILHWQCNVQHNLQDALSRVLHVFWQIAVFRFVTCYFFAFVPDIWFQFSSHISLQYFVCSWIINTEIAQLFKVKTNMVSNKIQYGRAGYFIFGKGQGLKNVFVSVQLSLLYDNWAWNCNLIAMHQKSTLHRARHLYVYHSSLNKLCSCYVMFFYL